MNWFYFYEVQYWDDEMKTERGFIQARSFSEVAEDIESYYGRDQVEKLTITPIENGDGPLTVSKIMKALDGRIKDVE